MTKTTLTPEQQETIIDAAYRVDAEVESYSGRFMYGEKCLSITVSGVGMFATFLVDIARDDHSLACLLADGIRTDDMGYDMVVYWPGIDWKDDEDESEDDED